MVDASLTISIDRSGMAGSPAALEFSGKEDGTALRIVSYSPPGLLTQVEYMNDSPDVHGSEAMTSRYLQGVLAFSWYRGEAASETQVQAAYGEVAAAIAQFSFPVTTQVSGAPAQTWRADPGGIALGGSNGRTYADLVTLTPVYTVTIPVYPIPEA